VRYVLYVPFISGENVADTVSDYKVRPAVVVEADARTVAVLPCSSAQSRFTCRQRYHKLADLKSAGLSRPTGVRLASIRLDRSEIVAIRGRLGQADAAVVLAC
jgi:hypothetical protein